MSTTNSSTPEPAAPEPGQEEGAGRRQRRPGRGHRNSNRDRQPSESSDKKFTGLIEQLENNVYDVDTRSPTDSFTRTTEAIALYVSSHLDKAGEYQNGLTKMALPVIALPSPPADMTNPVLVALFTEEIKAYSRALEARKNNQGKVFGIIMGQCTTAMKNQIAADTDWQSINDGTDVIGLLKLIRGNSHAKQTRKETTHVLIDAINEFYSYKQEQTVNGDTRILNTHDYYLGFKERLENLERLQGPVGHDEARVTDYLIDVMHVVSPNEDETARAKAACRDKLTATLFLFNASRTKFQRLQTDLQNNFVMYGNPYPSTLTADAYQILLLHLKDHKTKSNHQGNNQAMLFFQQDESGTGGRWRGGRSGRGGGASGRGRGAGGRGNPDADQASRPSPSGDSTTPGTPNSSNQTVAPYMPPAQQQYQPETVDSSPVTTSVSLQQQDSSIPRTWVILDSASTIDMFINRDLLIDIHESESPLTMISNAGHVTIHLQGTLPGYPLPVWYHPSGVANVLSLQHVQQHFHVTMCRKTPGMTVRLKNTNNRRALHFRPSDTGLYYYDTRPTTSTHRGYLFLTTVSDKKAEYTRRGVQQATLARRVQNIIMRPPARRFMDIVSKNHIRNCPIERRHIQAAEDIYGPNLGALIGKTPRRTTGHVIAQTDPVPPEVLLASHGQVTLAIDIMFINKLPFLVTISRGLHIGSIHALPNRQVDTVAASLRGVLRRYRRRGFHINTILGDDEFHPLLAMLPNYHFNLCGADEHVPDIERYIRTTKDTIRSGYNNLPFRHMPKIMITRLAENAVFWQNAFPHADSTTPDLSPRYLIDGRRIDYNKHVCIPFGAYAHTHEQHDHNSMAPRTVSAICLGPTGNEQGTHYFYSIATGRVLTRPHFTELPMPSDVIDRISDIGRQQGMPPTLTFTNRLGHELIDAADDVDDQHDSDYEYEPSEDDASTASYASTSSSSSSYSSSSSSSYSSSDRGSDSGSSSGDDASTHPPAGVIIGNPDRNRGGDLSVDNGQVHRHHIPGPNLDGLNRENATIVLGNVPDIPCPNSTDDYSDDYSDNESEDTQEYEHQNDERQEYHNEPQVEPARTAVDHVGHDQIDHTIEVAPEEIPGVTGVNTGTNAVQPHDANNAAQITGVHDETAGVSQNSTHGKRNLRPRNKRNPTHLLGRGFEDEFIFLTAQMSAKKGLKIFGQPGADAIVAELQQLHYRQVVKPVLGEHLTRDQKRAALHYLMFLKQKRCGKIKARGCADGRKQRVWKTKEETTSPTVRTESVFISATIDAHERRAVMTCDIPGAFMQADIDEVVHVKFEGEIAELLVKVDPALYEQYVKYKHGKPVIYVKLEKALYGTLQAAMLFWKELTAYLVDVMGFTINPYDRCVANKVIDGKQCTILWHVDDLKISHISQEVLENLLGTLNQRFGQEQPLTVTRGRIHDYLGMTIDYTEVGKVKFTMFDFIDSIINENNVFSGTTVSNTPAADHLFDVNPSAELLPQADAEMFHTMVAKLLYLCKRTRSDIHTAVAFLTTRVSRPDVDDAKKLRRVIQYLRGTRDIPLTLETADPGQLRWWVDASFAVHPDMRSHTGATLSMGKGMIYSSSTRQKINTRSSTEAELVGVEEAMTGILWTRHFLEGQGVTVTDNVVYQDNQSAMLLENNGVASSGKRTRHINIRYFFAKDRIDKGEMRVEYCPTQDMIADILTKPLQGSLFRKLRDLLLNHSPYHSATSQECVETSYSGMESTQSDHHIVEEYDMDSDVANGTWTLVEGRKKRAKGGARADEYRSAHTPLRI